MVGNSSCPIVDTWWQTETGAMMITPVAGFTAMKPEVLPSHLGIEPALLDENGEEIVGEGSGNSLLNLVGPQIRTVYGDHQRCVDTYYSMYPGYYTTGDAAEEMLTDIIGLQEEW